MGNPGASVLVQTQQLLLFNSLNHAMQDWSCSRSQQDSVEMGRFWNLATGYTTAFEVPKPQWRQNE